MKIGEHEIEDNVVIQALKASNYIVRTAEEENSVMKQNFETRLSGMTHKDPLLISKFGDALKDDRIATEGRVKAITGIDKLNDSEKLSDYLPRAYSSKIEELELKAKEGLKNDDILKELNDLKLAKEESEKALNKQISDLKTEQEVNRKVSEIDRALAGLRPQYKDTIEKELIESHEKMIVQSVLDSSLEFRKIGDKEELYKVDESGSIVYDESGAAVTSSSLLKNGLKTLLDEGRTQNGLGTQKPSNTSKTGTSFNATGFTNQVELSNALTKAGIQQASKEWDEAFEKYKDLPLGV